MQNYKGCRGIRNAGIYEMQEYRECSDIRDTGMLRMQTCKGCSDKGLDLVRPLKTKK